MTTATSVQHHHMIILDHTGDTKLIWDVDNADEVDAAKATFDKLRKKGYVAYSVNKKQDKGEVLTEFDPHIEKMILAPQLKGG